jgi:hypothetical protein
VSCIAPQSGSKFGNSNVVLGGRFVLLGMLGKGGFSEVFKVGICVFYPPI